MRRLLTLAVAQPPTVALDVLANAETHAAAIQLAETLLVVFPELSLTGYEFRAPAVAADDPRLAPIVEACRATGATALVGAPVGGTDGLRSIGVLAIDGSGARIAYRKMWLGDAEAAEFARGTELAAIDVDGWRIGLAVCRDTGIAQHAADTTAPGIDVYAAGVLELASDVAVPEERARRIAADHGLWVAMASFAGGTGEGYDEAAGCSGLWSPDGTAVARAGAQTGEIARATITDR